MRPPETISRVGSTTPSAEAPVEDLAGPGARAVDQQEVGAELRRTGRSAGSPAANALIVHGTRSRTHRASSARLAAVQLHGAEPDPVGDLDDPLARLVPEHPDGQDARGAAA